MRACLVALLVLVCVLTKDSSTVRADGATAVSWWSEAFPAPDSLKCYRLIGSHIAATHFFSGQPDRGLGVVQDAGEHGYALLGKDTKRITAVAAGFFYSSNWEWQSIGFFIGELEHEIVREVAQLALHKLVQIARGHPIQLGEVSIEHDLFAADQVDAAGDAFDGKDGFYFVHGSELEHLCTSIWVFLYILAKDHSRVTVAKLIAKRNHFKPMFCDSKNGSNPTFVPPLHNLRLLRHGRCG